MRPGEREVRMVYIDRDGVRFRRLCLRHRPTEIKGSHLLEIPFREAPAETLGKVMRQTLENPLSVGSACCSPLLMLNDPTAASVTYILFYIVY